MRLTTGVAVLFAIAGSASAQTFLGPTPYLSLNDSPWQGFQGFAVEDFEDGLFNLPGASASVGNPLAPGSSTDSVDGDDGSIDGSGIAGRSFFSGSGSAGITFTLNADEIGFIPTRVGIVWTDGAGEISFEAFDLQGMSLGIVTGNHATAGFSGQTDEDRFYGIAYDAGIGSIHVRNSAGGIEVDHLQYALPAPGVVSVLAAGGLLASRRRR